jgi:hypothetical protein
MNETATRSSASLWRIAAVGLLGALIGIMVLKPADAGQPKTKVLKPTKVIVAEGSVAGGAGNDDVTTATCPAGWQVTGGGVDFVSSDPDVTIPYNGPLVRGDNLVAADAGTNPAAKAWRVRVENNSGSGWDYSVGAICSKPVKVLR